MSEPFPLLSTTADQLHALGVETATAVRRRTKSTGHGGTEQDGPVNALHVKDAHPSRGAGGSTAAATSAATPTPTSARFSKRRKARSLLRRCKAFAVRHTWVLPAFILSIFGLLYALNPTPSNPLHHFIFLSYAEPVPAGSPPGTPVQYGKGPWDIAFVTFYVVVLSFTREFIMQEILKPLARYCGLRSRSKKARFMEQMYTAIYFGFTGPVGMYIMSRSPVWYFSTRGMYEGFPHKTHEALFKFYYLFQAAYWAQQAIVLALGMEKPRKDFKELVGHHIVSLFLIGLSYRFHFTYIGLAVYITHDISDFFLATSKTLNYLDHWLTGPYYAFFVFVWIYMRHYLNLRIIYSLFNEFKTVGPYELDWDAGQYKCTLSFVITLALLGSLQCLNIFWLFFIIRIAYRYVVHNIAKDDRSDAEESEPEPEVPGAADAPDRKIKPAANEATPLSHSSPSSNGTVSGSAKVNGSAAKKSR